MRAMKDSGIEWIKEIPESWQVLRGKNILTLMKRSPEGFDEVITCFRDGEVTLRSKRREDGFTFSDKEIGYQGILQGDLVIHGMDGFAGAIGISDSDGKGSPVLVVCKSSEDVVFLMYYLRMLATQNVFLALATGIRERSCDLRWNKIAELLFPVPPLAEQQRIASYLDSKCSKIDSIVAKQQQLIEKLKEYKQAVITEAVTKGLNPDVPMKDSGIEWIGEIPEHWSKDKVFRVFDCIGSGTTPKFNNEQEHNGQVNWIQSGDLNGEDLWICKQHISEDVVRAYSSLKLYEAPFIIIAMYGASIGNMSISHINGCVNQACCVLKDSRMDLKFAFYALSSAKQYMIYLGIGGGQPNISQDLVKKLWLPLPPIGEQRNIVRFIDAKCQFIHNSISRRQQLITKLQEYKKSLIYEVVTGKREVPNV